MIMKTKKLNRNCLLDQKILHPSPYDYLLSCDICKYYQPCPENNNTTLFFCHLFNEYFN